MADFVFREVKTEAGLTWKGVQLGGSNVRNFRGRASFTFPTFSVRPLRERFAFRDFNTLMFRDNAFFHEVASPKDAITLQNGLHAIGRWAADWRLLLNASKCKEFRTTMKRNFVDSSSGPPVTC